MSKLARDDKDKIVSLEQTWIDCLEMWRILAEKFINSSKEDKARWGFRVHLYKLEYLDDKGEDLPSGCYFCEYAQLTRVTNGNYGVCHSCPGRLVDRNFSCLHSHYSYESRPDKFYEKLLELDKIRRGKNDKERKSSKSKEKKANEFRRDMESVSRNVDLDN